MKLRLRLLVELDREGRATASVLGLPGGPPPGEPADDPVASPLAAYGEDEDAALAALSREIERRAEELDPSQLALWRFDPEQTLGSVSVPVSPVDFAGEALDAIPVDFAIVVTARDGPPHPVFVPKLGLVLAAADAKKIEEAARTEIGAFLKKNPALRGLDRIHALHPSPQEKLVTLDVEVAVKTPLEAARARARDAEAARGRALREDAKVLESVCVDLSAEAKAGRLDRSFGNDALVDEILAFFRSGERAILLVGPSGSGKTAALHEAIHRRLEAREPGEVWHATGSRLVAGMSGFGEWQERCRAVVAAARERRAVLSVGDPLELVESGRAVGFDASIAQYLKRPLEDGHLRAIGECTPEARDALERRDRGFLSLFRIVRVEEPDRARTLAILARFVEARARAAPGRSRIAGEALALAYDLHARFAPYEAFPGKTIRFLSRLERDLPHEPSRTFSRADLVRAFARATGLPEVVLADDRALDPDSVRGSLRERVLGQDRATALVADVVARVKAGVADPRRPLGSLLFLGPTGVGKTETAKALAEFLFGKKTRLVRLDMTEYQDSLAAARLVGGALGEAGDLTRPVRAEPLSVVLLDEIEKAHPSVYDLLLQVLGDARLTDARGRLTDFRSTIVILTSNLGAELPEGSLGFDERKDAGSRFLEAAHAFFRPELVNRLDAIVPFSILPRETIRKIASREIESALSRDGLARRGTAVDLAPALMEGVLATGYHPLQGARPLKRAIERLVVRPLAFHLSGRADAPARLRVELDGKGASGVLEVEGARAPSAASSRIESADALLARVSALRRTVRAHLRGDTCREARDEAKTLRSFFEKRKPRAFSAETGKHRRRVRLEAVLAGLEAARGEVEGLEDLAIAILLERDDAQAGELEGDAAALAAKVEEFVFRLRATRFEPPDAALLLLAPLPREKPLVLALAASHLAFASSHRYSVKAWCESRKTAKSGKVVPVFLPVRDPFSLSKLPEEARPVPQWTGAVVLLVEGENAFPRFVAEDGRHRHVPVLQSHHDRHALVRVRALERSPERKPGELEAALANCHTLPLPEEDGPRGIPSALPDVARIYKDRGKHPTVQDPRTREERAGRFEDAARFQDAFAFAWLAREAP